MTSAIVAGVLGGGTTLMMSQHDVFGPQPDNITKDVQERAERVGNAVYYTISVSDKEESEFVEQAILNEIARASLSTISYSGDDFEISKKYINYLNEAKDVVSATGGNSTNQTTINKIDRELAQMNEAKKNLY